MECEASREMVISLIWKGFAELRRLQGKEFSRSVTSCGKEELPIFGSTLD